MNEKPVIRVPLEYLTLGIIIAFCAMLGDDILKRWFHFSLWGIRPTIYLGFISLPFLVFGRAPRFLEIFKDTRLPMFVRLLRWLYIIYWGLVLVTGTVAAILIRVLSIKIN
ncbi:MAG: hypothetical protein ACYC0V_03575 [Armatimonadota bacterium]